MPTSARRKRTRVPQRHRRLWLLVGLAAVAQPATELVGDLSPQLTTLNLERDILLVDQRGTGGSDGDHDGATQYGTRMAMDDLDAVRKALGYRQLNVIGSSYGATAAQVYLRLHPASCARRQTPSMPATRSPIT